MSHKPLPQNSHGRKRLKYSQHIHTTAQGASDAMTAAHTPHAQMPKVVCITCISHTRVLNYDILYDAYMDWRHIHVECVYLSHFAHRVQTHKGGEPSHHVAHDAGRV